MDVDGDGQVDRRRERWIGKSRLAREARRGIVIVTVMEEWPRGGMDDRGRTRRARRADSCAQAV